MRKKKVVETPTEETNIIETPSEEEKASRPEIEFITDDTVDDIRNEEAGKTTKTKTGKAKKNSEFKFKVELISVFPALVLDAFFIRLGYSKLSEDEKKNLSEAFVVFIESLPQAFIDYILKASGLIGIVVVLSQIIVKRKSESKEKSKQKSEEKIDIEEFTQ